MAVPVISNLPPAPTRSDGPADFTPKADAMIGALQPMVVQVNIATQWMAGQLTEAQAQAVAAAVSALAAANSATAANASKNAAAQSAIDATNNGAAQVTLAADQVVLANAARNSAEVLAAAAQAAAGAPSLLGNAYKVLRVNAAGTAVAWTSEQQIGDLLSTARNPGALYLPAGGIYLQSAYPALFAAVGLIGADAFVSWSALTSPTAASINGVDWGRNNVWVAVCHGGMILRSTDNGNSFSIQTTIAGTPALTAVATDRNGVWITVGANGNVYRSTDDGATWIKASMPGATTQAFNDIACDKNGVWLIAGASNVFRSSDNGVSWIAITMPATGPYLGIGTDENLTFLISNDSSGANLNVSVNRGISFTGVGSASAYRGTDFAYDKEKKIWYGSFQDAGVYQNRAVGTGGVWVSTNSSNGSQNSSQIGVADGALVKVGMSAGTPSILRSVDDGYSFTTITNPIAGTPKSLASKSDGTAVFVTSSGAMAKSVKSYSYDTATQFKLPSPLPVTGLTAYIKALEAA